MIATLGTIVSGPAAALTRPNSESKELDQGGYRPDSVSAMVTARSSGERIEDLSQRTATMQVFANPDGTWTAEQATEPVRVLDAAGEWQDVDTTLVERDGALVPRYAASDVRLSDGGDRLFAQVSEAGKDLAWKWPTALPEPVVEGNTATYVGAVEGGDLVVVATATGFTHSIVLRERPDELSEVPAAPEEAASGGLESGTQERAADEPEPVRYEIPVATDGATIRETPTGGLEISKANGDEVTVAPSPLMWDAETTANGDPANVVPVGVDVSAPGQETPDGGTAGANPVLTLTPDQDFLADPDTEYPVTIDPSFTTWVNGDTWIQNSGFTTSQAASDELRAGTYDGGDHIARSYLQFPSSPFAGKDITNATLWMRNWYANSCSAANINATRITESWTVSGLTWANRPNFTNVDMGVFSTAYGSSGCPADGAHWDVTEIVDGWANGTFANYGLQIRANTETANASWRRYRSINYTDTAVAPRLVITYNSPPSTPTETHLTPADTDGGTTFVRSTTPSVSSVISDPDGGALRGYFEVYNSAGTALLWSGASGWATSGARVTKNIPSGVLADGVSYKLKAYSQDATLNSTTSQTLTVTVDTDVPYTVITATNYTNNTWTNPMPGSNTFTFNGPNDTATFDAMLDGVPTTLAANSSGDFSFPYTYVAEWHVFEVAAVDKAGNRGPTATFQFGSGAPGFTTPKQNGVTTSVFPLDISAQPTSTGATLTWKLEGETSWRNVTEITKAGAAWTGAVSTSGGRSTTGQLLWDAAAEEVSAGVTLEAPALIRLRACFHYTSAADQCTYQRTLQLVPSAFGGNFPTADLGPATVALHTGEAMISDMDGADSKAGIGRSFSSYGAATLNDGVFGPGWSDVAVLTSSNADTAAEVIDNRTKDGTFVVVYPDSGSQAFTLDTGTTYRPLVATGDDTRLVFTAGSGGSPDMLELFRPLGAGTVSSTWELKSSDTGGDPAWTPTATDAPGTQGDLAITSDHQRPTFIRESDPNAAATCTAATQTVGCRALTLTYTGTGASTRVASISRVIGAATPGAVQTKTLATYTYSSGKLSTVCSAIPAAGKPALCTGYTYSTVGGRTLLAELTPPGLKKWRFAYDTSGRLLNVKRERPTGGDSTWSIDYTLTPASSGLPNLGATAAAEWGQTTIPTKVYAVYEPYTGTASVTKANLYYTTADGTLTNTATHGPSSWLVDTTWLSEDGNQVRHLDGTGWARVQAASAADRPAVAAEASSYTLYNTWGDVDTAGTLVVDEYGPAHTATLKNGTVGLFRTHSHTMYDNDPNVDTALIATRPGTDGLSLAVRTTESTSNAAMTADYDAVHTKYGYDPIVSGDGNGWALGAPTKVSHQLGSGWSDAIARYDSSGRTIETRQPGGSAGGSGAGNDSHSTITTYYTASGSGDCGGQPAWDGLVCKVGPAAQPSGTTIPFQHITVYNDGLQPATTLEVSGGVTARTTSTSYDALGRSTEESRTTSGSGVAHSTFTTTYQYDDEHGLPLAIASGGDAVTVEFDSWARVVAYADGLGTSSSLSYDTAGNIESFDDGTASYSYTYGDNNQLTSLAIGGGVGNFAFGYTELGYTDAITYPNGVVAKWGYNELGSRTSLVYSQGSSELLSFSAVRDVGGTTIAHASNASVQGFAHDEVGRLVQVRDHRQAGCITRSYGFNASSDRSTFSSFGPDATGGCQTTAAAVAESSDFDTAGRIVEPGYVYDTLGRALSVPAGDTRGTGPLHATYHANDMVASLSQEVVNGAGTDDHVMSYSIDPVGRINAITSTTDGVETSRLRYRFAGFTDAPSVVETSVTGGNSWQTIRYASVPGLGVVAATTNGVTQIMLANLNGDLVASVPNTSGASLVDDYREYDEYGNPQGEPSPNPRYGWLGTFQRSGDTVGGMVLMGARLFNPLTGMFLSRDPISGGNATPYTYPQSPIDMTDLSGMVKAKKYDSRIPTYDYYRVWFNKRETYKIAYWAGGATLAFSLVAAVASGALANAAGILAAVAGYIVWRAADAEHDGKCLALKIYKQRRYWWGNPPGPDFFINAFDGGVYKTSYNCTGSYRHG